MTPAPAQDELDRLHPKETTMTATTAPVVEATRAARVTDSTAITGRYIDASGRRFDTLPEGAVVGPWGSHPWAVLPVDYDGYPLPVPATIHDPFDEFER